MGSPLVSAAARIKQTTWRCLFNTRRQPPRERRQSTASSQSSPSLADRPYGKSSISLSLTPKGLTNLHSHVGIRLKLYHLVELGQQILHIHCLRDLA